MATTNTLGLFVSPEQYQAQQLAQQQAAEQQRAFNFAQLSPRDQAVYGTFLGAQQLGRGFSGLLGVQDPQLQRIRQREQIMQSINPADPESLMAGIQRASQSNDPELALTLANYMREAASNVALTKQRETEKVPQDIQIAARIRQLTADRLKLPENERGPIDAEIKRLEKLGRQGSTDKVEQLRDLYVAEEDAVRKAQAKAAPSQTVGLDGLPMATRVAVNVDDDPEVRAIRSLIRVATGDKEGKEVEVVAKATALADTVSSDRNSATWKEKYKTELTRLTADKDTEKTTDAIANATALANATGNPKDSAEWKNEFNTQLKRLTTKEIADKYSPEAQKLIDAGYIPGSPSFISKMDELIRGNGNKANLTVVGEIKSGVDKGKPVYVDEVNDQQFIYSKDSSGKQVRKLVSDVDVDRMTSQITASASSSTSPGVKAFREKLGGLDAKDVESARANRDNAIAALNTLNELTRLDQQGVTSGAFADGRIGAVNLLNTLGLVSNRDAGTLANSQTFNKVSGDLILATLGGKLGAGFSNEDRKFITGLVPQLETSRKARQQLINFMAKKNQLIIDEAIRLEDYARENDGLKGFKPKIPIVNAPAPGSVQALSDSELKAAIEKAKKGK